MALTKVNVFYCFNCAFIISSVEFIMFSECPICGGWGLTFKAEAVYEKRTGK